MKVEKKMFRNFASLRWPHASALFFWVVWRLSHLLYSYLYNDDEFEFNFSSAHYQKAPEKFFASGQQETLTRHWMYFLHCDSALQVNDYGKFGTTIFSGLFYLFYIYAVNFLFHKRRKKKTFNAIEEFYTFINTPISILKWQKV